MFSTITLLIGFSVNHFAMGKDSLSDSGTNILIQWRVDSGAQTSATQSPDLTVYTDGRVEVGPRFTAGRQVVQAQLSDTELDALHHLVFKQNNIWTIDSAQVDQDVANIGRKRASQSENNITVLGTESIADAGTTIIRVQEGNRVKRISHYNLAADAQNYSEIEALSRLRAIEQRLIELARQLAASAD